MSRSASTLASGAKVAYQGGAGASAGGPVRAAGAGLANVAKAGASTAGQRVAAHARAMKNRAAGFVAEAAAPVARASTDAAGARPVTAEPAWAQRMRRRQHVARAATSTAHVLRSGDHHGGGSGPSLRDASS